MKKPTKNQEVVDKWIAALRSGDYKQGRGYLCRNNSHCCLGVLCEILDVKKDPADLFGVQSYGSFDSRTSLPANVADLVGISSVDGNFDYPINIGGEGNVFTLADLNDRGWSFEQIADFIESNPEGLFYDDHSESSTESS